MKENDTKPMMVSPDDDKNFGHLFSESGSEVEIGEIFSKGDGVIQITPEMEDSVILLMIKAALKASNGKRFTVIGTPDQ